MREIVPGNNLTEQLDAHTVPCTFQTAPGGHNAGYWSQHLEEYIHFLVASTRQIGEFLTALGEPGRALYARALWWDFLVALVVPAALALSVLWLVHRLPPVWGFLRWLVLIPVGFAVADVAENALLLMALASFPEAASSWTATAASAKLMLGLASIPIVAVLGVMCVLLRGGR